VNIIPSLSPKQSINQLSPVVANPKSLDGTTQKLVPASKQSIKPIEPGVASACDLTGRVANNILSSEPSQEPSSMLVEMEESIPAASDNAKSTDRQFFETTNQMKTNLAQKEQASAQKLKKVHSNGQADSILTYSTFFKCFSYNATSKHLNSTEKKVALAAAILMGTLTLGLTPLICWTVHSKNRDQHLKKKYKDIISKVADPWLVQKPDEKKLTASSKVRANRVIKNLYLGNSWGLVSATYLPHQTIETSNPYKFKNIVTLCPLTHVRADCYNLLKTNKAKEFRLAIKNAFQENQKVQFKYYGKLIFDDPKCWEPLVFDCTFSDHTLAQIEGTEDLDIEDIPAIYHAKEELLQKTKVSDWFQDVFKDLDKGAFGEDITLIHCQAGISRSASVLAAYLINRFDVSSEAAIAFLRSKRLCVNPKFAAQLKEYETALYKERHEMKQP